MRSVVRWRMFEDVIIGFNSPCEGAGTLNQDGRPLGISAPTLGRLSSFSAFDPFGIASPPPPVIPSPLATEYGTLSITSFVSFDVTLSMIVFLDDNREGM